MRDTELTPLPLRDPDPISIILAALGAIGSVASIISLVQQHRNDEENLRRLEREDRSDLIEHLANAEASMADLAATISKVRLMAGLFGTQSLSVPLEIPRTSGALTFGKYGLLLDRPTLNQFLDMQDSAFRAARNIQKALSSAFKVLYRAEAGIPEENFNQLVAIIRDVNALLIRTDSLEDILKRAEAVADKAAVTMHALRGFISNGPEPTSFGGPQFG